MVCLRNICINTLHKEEGEGEEEEEDDGDDDDDGGGDDDDDDDNNNNKSYTQFMEYFYMYS